VVWFEPPGGSYKNGEVLDTWHLAVKVVSLSDSCKTVVGETLGASRHVSPARRSGSVCRLASLEHRQVIMQRSN